MTYICKFCNYETNRKQNFERHNKRKIPCSNTKYDNYNTVNGNFDDEQNNTQCEQNNTKGEQNNTKCEQNNTYHKCHTCYKTFYNSSSLNRHVRVCKGVHDNLTCSICFKKFNYQVAKHRHVKKNDCKPPPPPPNLEVTTKSTTIINIENQTNINNTTNNITNNTQNNTQNNTVHINVFGKEDLTYLLEDKNIIQKIKLFGKSGIYGFPKILNDVHFNINKPENNTIIKPDEFGDGVMIKNDNNEWEFREFEDVRDDLIGTIVKYFKAYNTVKNNLGIQLIENKERNIIKKFGYELLSLDGTLPKDLLSDLEIDADDETNDTDQDIKNKTRKFDKSTMKGLHANTTLHYKKDNGMYVKK